MSKTKKGTPRLLLPLLAAAVLFVLPVAGLFAYVFFADVDFLPWAVLGAMFQALVTFFALLVIALRRSLRKTLYAYRNIMLIALVLFIGAFIAAMLVFFVRTAGGFSAAALYEEVVSFPRRFSYWAVFVLSALCVLVGISNVALMCREGFRPKNALSLLVAALYIGGTFVVYWLSDLVENKLLAGSALASSSGFVFVKTALPLFLLLLLCYFECILAGTAVMGWLAARQVPGYDKDFIIILGCSIDRRGGLLPLLKGRVNRAIRYAWDQEIASGKPLKYVPSGGQGPNEVMSEGSAMELYLLTRGAEPDEVFPEKESRTTHENMLFSKRIIDTLKPDAKIAFATTNYHMLRSGIIAQQCGIDAEGIAGQTKWYFWPNGFIREFFAILKMHVRVHAAAAAVIAAGSVLVGLFAASGML